MSRVLEIRRIGNQLLFVDSRVKVDLTGKNFASQAYKFLEGGRLTPGSPSGVEEFLTLDLNIGSVGKDLAALVDISDGTTLVTGTATWADPNRDSTTLEVQTISYTVPPDVTQPAPSPEAPRPSLPSQEVIDALIREGIIGSQR